MSWKFRLVNTALMSTLLSLLMTLWVTWINLGLGPGFVARWLTAWALACPAAFVCVLLLAQPVAQLTRRLLNER